MGDCLICGIFSTLKTNKSRRSGCPPFLPVLPPLPRNFTKLLSTKLRINGNVDDQGLVCQSYCPCSIPARSGCYWSSTGSSDHSRHCLLRARRAGAEGRNHRDPSWNDRGGWGASAHPEEHRDDFLPSLRCACWFLECACAFHGAAVERSREPARRSIGTPDERDAHALGLYDSGRYR